MAKSKKQTDFERIESLTDTYRKFSDQQLINFVNVHWQGAEKKYRFAVNKEIKRRGLKIK